uniref:AMP-binding protein n=1 Tax=Nocardia brasiliensis TaxID=37326 RepID=UPI002458082F
MGGTVAINELVEQTAAQRPAECAVRVRGFSAGTSAEISWHGLVQKVHEHAAKYRDAGLREGAVAAVALPSGIGHVVATLALWEAGATVIPVDHRWSAATKERIVERYPRGWVVEGDDLGLVSYHRRAVAGARGGGGGVKRKGGGGGGAPPGAADRAGMSQPFVAADAEHADPFHAAVLLVHRARLHQVQPPP